MLNIFLKYLNFFLILFFEKKLTLFNKNVDNNFNELEISNAAKTFTNYSDFKLICLRDLSSLKNILINSNNLKFC